MQEVPMLGGALPTLQFQPTQPNGAAVIVVQEIFGVGDYIQDRCNDLAAEGFTVYAPDLYARLPQKPQFDPSAEDYVMQGVQASMAVDWDSAVADVAALEDEVRSQSAGKLGLVGFCYGGGLAFNVAAVNPPDSLVAFYGSALPNLLGLAGQVDVPSLHHFGTADPYIPLETVMAIREAVTSSNEDVEFYLYDGAGHAFDNPNPLFHHEQASALAWQRTIDFLHRTLG